MGGTAAWADPAEGLAVAVLKNVYEPLSALGGSISPDVVACATELRAALGLEDQLLEDAPPPSRRTRRSPLRARGARR